MTAGGMKQVGWYVACLCEECADTFRVGIWKLLAAAAKKRAPLKSV